MALRAAADRLTDPRTRASAIQSGNPGSVQKAIRTLKKFNGVVEQASEAELADAKPHEHNKFKVALGKGTLVRALLEAKAMEV